MKQEQALPRLRHALSEVLQAPAEEIAPSGNQAYEPDAELRACGHRFVVEFRSDASADRVGSGMSALNQVAQGEPEAVPLLVVPYMGDVGKRLCQEHGVSWLDLSGNANIETDNLRIRLEGRPNAHARPGRSRNLFAPKSSRLARALLLEPNREFTAAELVEETGIDRGNMSKLLSRYHDAGLLDRRGRRRGAKWSVIDPDLLLDTWREAYDFSDHTITKGLVPGLAGEHLLEAMVELFSGADVTYAATGLAAAWLIEPFATYRLVTLYTPVRPPGDLMRSAGFLDEPRGANLWLVQPDDEGVLMGSGETTGVCHVSGIQTYLDLKAQPERSREAAGALRDRLRSIWGDVGA